MGTRILRLLGTALAAAAPVFVLLPPVPARAATPVGLGAATSFAVLAGTTVTNTGPTTITGDVGVSPGTALTGFTSATVLGTQHRADGVADSAKTSLTAAYGTAAGQPRSATVTADLGGQRLAPGVYAGATLGLTGTLVLDAAGDPNAVFVFQAGSTLTTASTSVVALVRGASACNVFWQIGSSATLGTNSVFAGSVLALTSISATTGAKITGRLLARNGATTLDSNTITAPSCATVAGGSSPSASPSPLVQVPFTPAVVQVPFTPPVVRAPVATPAAVTAPSTRAAAPSPGPVATPPAPAAAGPVAATPGSPASPGSPLAGSPTPTTQGYAIPRPPTGPRFFSNLPHTGADLALMALAALVSVGGGMLLLLSGKRRRLPRA